MYHMNYNVYIFGGKGLFMLGYKCCDELVSCQGEVSTAAHWVVVDLLVVFVFQILKERFGMVAPDVQIEDGKGTILISSEEGETEGKENGGIVVVIPQLDRRGHCGGVNPR